MSLSAFILAAVTSLGGPSLSADDAARYATDIYEIAGDDPILALAMVATADEEGKHFSPRIERCECLKFECDRDAKSGKPRAFGMFQLHRFWLGPHEPEAICASNRLSTERAAHVLVTLRKRYRGSIRLAMRMFNGAPATDPRIVRRMKVFERLVANWQRKAAAS